jgi:phosphate transport system ATP-binding protein
MDIKFDVCDFNLFIHSNEILKNINLKIHAKQIFGIIGPAGSGKTSFLRALNRMNDLEFGFRLEGKVLLDGEDIYSPDYNVVSLRKKVGMLFALPVALPMSIFDNVSFGPRLSGITGKSILDELVEKSLSEAFLWDEVKDRLKLSGMRLSGGQQQRLCLARVLAMNPDVILLDEPCSGLDPISTAQIEDALTVLKKDYTIILVTNNNMQAARISDNVAFFLMSKLVETGSTKKMFTAPEIKETSDYITGRFG